MLIKRLLSCRGGGRLFHTVARKMRNHDVRLPARLPLLLLCLCDDDNDDDNVMMMMCNGLKFRSQCNLKGYSECSKLRHA